MLKDTSGVFFEEKQDVLNEYFCVQWPMPVALAFWDGKTGRLYIGVPPWQLNDTLSQN